MEACASLCACCLRIDAMGVLLNRLARVQQRVCDARSVCSAVIDKYGFLWTGAGDYQWGATLTNPGQANSSSVSGGQFGVLRIPVGAVAGTGLGNGINGGHPTFFPVGHETNVRLPAHARPTRLQL